MLYFSEIIECRKSNGGMLNSITHNVRPVIFKKKFVVGQQPENLEELVEKTKLTAAIENLNKKFPRLTGFLMQDTYNNSVGDLGKSNKGVGRND